MMEKLLARYADAAFWMARYMERAENLARILDVNETFARDDRGEANWLSIVRLSADEDRFFARHGEASAENVLRFYVIDDDNPTSIRSAVRLARENARTLRPLISTEMWSHLNMFHNRMLALRPGDLSLHRLNKVCSEVKESCQAHTGIVEGTFYRDQGWYFYELGRHLERADQTTRLLDVKYHILLPPAHDVGSPLDLSQWNALLRSAAGYHAYRRVHPRGLTAADVAGFLLFNSSFPRSVLVAMRQVNGLLTELKSRYMLRGGNVASERVDEMLAVIASHSIEQVIASGLHEFVDWLQRQVNAVSDELARSFFGYHSA